MALALAVLLVALVASAVFVSPRAMAQTGFWMQAYSKVVSGWRYASGWFGTPLAGTISGNTFRDFNANGVDDGAGNHALDLGFATDDFGDLPDTGAGTGAGNYETLAANNGPRHAIVSGLQIGATVDDEADGQPSATASGDDAVGASDDEDGVTVSDLALTKLTTSNVRVAVTNTTGAATTLYGWIDFDGDGLFELVERASVAVPNGFSGTMTLNFGTVPQSSVAATFARFRLSSDPAAAQPTGAASDGEVEDYPVTIAPGINLCPVDTLTTSQSVFVNTSSPGASTVTGAGILGGERDMFLERKVGGGIVSIDANLSAPQELLLSNTASSAAVATIAYDGLDGDATMLNPIGLGGLDMSGGNPFYLEFTNDNIIGLVRETQITIRVYTDASNWSTQTKSLTQALNDPAGNSMYIPLIFSPAGFTVGAGAGANFANVGAIQLIIDTIDIALDVSVRNFLGPCPILRDFGDLPDIGAGTAAGNYETLLADNGPHHRIVPNLRIGANLDSEGNGQPGANATGDDTNGAPDDEDGIASFPTFLPGSPATVNVTITNSSGGAATLYGFIDWNNDGDFLDAGEAVTATVPNGTAGQIALNFNVPASAVTGVDLGARFRLSTEAELDANGPASDGEVEDYIIQVAPVADLSITKTDGVTSYTVGGTLTYTVVVTNNGLSAVTGAIVTDTRPSQISSWAWACTGATGGATDCTPAASSANNFSDTVDLPVGATITYTVTAQIAAGVIGNLVNTACVAPPTGTTDTNPANDCSTDTDAPAVYSLGNRIWLDNSAGGGTINDGMQNGAEPGLAGVSISLFVDADMNGAPDTPGTPVATVVTDSGGYYRFDNVATGKYVVRVNPGSFAAGQPLFGLLSSTGAVASNTNQLDQKDNGVDNAAPATNGILSATIDLATKTIPIAETDNQTPGTYGAGATTGTEADNAHTDLTIDFSFVPVADLGITKVVTPSTYVQGSTTDITYTVVVTNYGPSEVSLASVTDSAPADVTFNSWTCAITSAGTGNVTNACGAASGSGNVTTTVTLRNGAAATFTINATVGAGATGAVTNTATESLPPGVIQDPNINRTDTASISITPDYVADLEITKSVAGTGYAPGGSTNITYTVVVTNHGPSDVTSATVTDNAPANVTFNSWMCAITASGTGSVTNACGAASGSGSISTSVTLRNGAAATLTINATVGAGATGTVTNTASESLPLGVTQGTPNQPDTASASVTPLPFSLGNRVWFDTDNSGTLNGAEVGVNGVKVRLLDAAGNPVTDIHGNPLADQITAGGGYYRFDDLLAGDYLVEVTAMNFTAGMPLYQYASSTVDEANPNADVDGNDNGLGGLPNATTGVRSGVVTLGPGVNTEPTGDNDPGTNPQEGEALNGLSNRTVDFGFFRLCLGNLVWKDTNNNGLVDASEQGMGGLMVELIDSAGNVVQTTTTAPGGTYAFCGLLPGDYRVRVMLPTGYGSSTGAGAANGSYEPAPDPDDNTDNDDNGANVVGQAGKVISLPIMLLPAAEPSVDNATATTTNDRLDFGAVLASDLAIMKTHAMEPFMTGVNGEYTITVRNLGPSATVGPITVTDALPTGLNYLSGSGTGWTCSAVGQLVTCTNPGPLAANATTTITLTVGVFNAAAPAVINSATVSVATDNNDANNTASDPTGVTNGMGGPGAANPETSVVSDQKSGSILIYPIHSSDAANPQRENTRINLTNVDPVKSICAHLFFVDGSSCVVADSYVCLTPQQTTSFLASDVDPGTSGYIVAVATDDAGCPVSYNKLIGDEYVKLSTGHQANLAAVSFSALYSGALPGCTDASVTAQINFDGAQYNHAPRVLAASNLGSLADGNSPLLVINRVGGNLGTGAAGLGPLFGIVYDDAEISLSFNIASGACQLRQALTNDFPRTAPRLGQFIPSGRTGWFKLWSANEWGLVGSLLNSNPNAAASSNAFNGGHNLHVLRLNTADSYIIPIFPPSR